MSSKPAFQPPWGEGFCFEVWQDEQPVAWVDAPDEATAVREVMHYVMMYGQDGPVTVCTVTRTPFNPLDGPR